MEQGISLELVFQVGLNFFDINECAELIYDCLDYSLVSLLTLTSMLSSLLTLVEEFRASVEKVFEKKFIFYIQQSSEAVTFFFKKNIGKIKLLIWIISSYQF